MCSRFKIHKNVISLNVLSFYLSIYMIMSHFNSPSPYLELVHLNCLSRPSDLTSTLYSMCDLEKVSTLEMINVLDSGRNQQ